jgi:hypothetical protein
MGVKSMDLIIEWIALLPLAKMEPDSPIETKATLVVLVVGALASTGVADTGVRASAESWPFGGETSAGLRKAGGGTSAFAFLALCKLIASINEYE